MRMVFRRRALFCFPLALYALTACQGASSGAPPIAATQPPGATTQSALGPGSSVIQRVIMENRSFDNLFQGFPGADTASSGPTSTGATQQNMPVTFENPCDPDHSLTVGAQLAMVEAFTEALAPVSLSTTAFVPPTTTAFYAAIAFDPYLKEFFITDAGDNTMVAFTESGTSVTLPTGAFANLSDPLGIAIVP